MFSITSTGGDLTLTITATGSPSLKVSISEWSGLNDAPVEDAQPFSDALSSAVQFPHYTPVSTNNLVIVVAGWTANNYSSGPTNGFTRMTPVGSLSAYQEVAYRVNTSATETRPTYALTAPVNYATVIAEFGAP